MLVCSCSSVGVRALHLRFIFTAVQVAEGDVIGVRYKGTLDDGSVFDENPEGPLLEFEVGAGRVIRGFDDAVIGLKLGESRKVTCEPKDAYGEYDEKNVAEVPMEQMPTPPDGELKEGASSSAAGWADRRDQGGLPSSTLVPSAPTSPPLVHQHTEDTLLAGR